MVDAGADVRSVLREIARVASVMFDGELCHQIVTERAWKALHNVDPDDPYVVSDNYDVEHGPFIAAKKTLLRLERLAPATIAVSCALWVPVPTFPGDVALIVWNHKLSRWWKGRPWHLPTTPEMVAAMTSGQVQDVPDDDSGITTVIAPVRDSFKEVSGFIEVSASSLPLPMPW
ncbi:MAG: hypothetical protein N2255_08055 [Kiritimatiellae bacterium]|nr:hypothetical protein [Kiritimatiellia bacterium]